MIQFKGYPIACTSSINLVRDGVSLYGGTLYVQSVAHPYYTSINFLLTQTISLISARVKQVQYINNIQYHHLGFGRFIYSVIVFFK